MIESEVRVYDTPEFFVRPETLVREDNPSIISVTVKKEVTSVPEEIDLDQEPQELRDLIYKVRSLRTFPERNRPRQIMDLLRKKIDYSFETTLLELGKDDRDLPQAVRRNNASPLIGASVLREAVRLRFANCNALAISMLILGKEAGLEGAYLTNAPYLGEKFGEDPNPIRNVLREDTNQKLFREYEINQNLPEGHSWVELRTRESEWIPVDPATKLVGDSEEELEIFRRANYKAALFLDVNLISNGRNLSHGGIRDLEFFPGEDVHSGRIEITYDESDSELISEANTEPIIPVIEKYQFASNLAVGVNFSIV